jgi:hypothetical protein
MSHITTIDTKIILKNEDFIKAAIKSMSHQFEGMTFEQTSPTVIKLRYKAIEGYQTAGNVQFIKDKNTGIWKMQLDTWKCAEEVQRVKEAFFVAYQETAVIAGVKARGYRVTTKRDGKNVIVTAVKY